MYMLLTAGSKFSMYKIYFLKLSLLVKTTGILKYKFLKRAKDRIRNIWRSWGLQIKWVREEESWIKQWEEDGGALTKRSAVHQSVQGADIEAGNTREEGCKRAENGIGM